MESAEDIEFDPTQLVQSKVLNIKEVKPKAILRGKSQVMTRVRA